MSNGFTKYTAVGGLGGTTVSGTLVANSHVTINIGSIASLDGVPRLLMVFMRIQLDNTANGTATGYQVQAPSPGFGPWTAMVEPSLSSVGFPAPFTIPANQAIFLSPTGLYTNLQNTGGSQPNGPQVNQGPLQPLQMVLGNTATSGGNSFNYWFFGFVVAVPIGWGDYGTFTFA